MLASEPLYISVVDPRISPQQDSVEIILRGQKPTTIYRKLQAKGFSRPRPNEGLQAYLDNLQIVRYSGYGRAPETITEAQALYQNYVDIEEPNNWPLFIQWCKRFNYKPSEEESLDKFERTFQGLYDSFDDYAVEYFQDHSGMALDSELSEYVAWDRFLKDLEISGDVVAIKDPHTGRFGMFEDFDQ